MKMFGDVSDEDRTLARELGEAEAAIDILEIVSDIKAKAYTCFAHDWYVMGMEEEGHRLIIKAEKAHPGYFESVQRQQMDQDPNYAYIVKNMAKHILLILSGSMDDANEV